MTNFVGVRPVKEPFILATQAQQVFYIKDRGQKGWKVMIKTKPRDNFDMDDQTTMDDDVETHLQSETSTCHGLEDDLDIDLVRGVLDGTVVKNIGRRKTRRSLLRNRRLSIRRRLSTTKQCDN